MAKTLTSVNFTLLLVVLVMASTGIHRSEAQILNTKDCFNKGVATCSLAAQRVFHGECGPAPFPLGDCDCCKCCMQIYGTAPVCYAAVEGSDKHCHCYSHV